jgi:hypothetical protein
MDILLGLAFSTHLGLEGNYNEFHPNFRLQTEQYIAGAYYNSEKNISLYVGKEINFDKLGLELGIVSGYDAYDYPVAPMARATYVLSEDHKFFIAPAYEKNSTGDTVGIVFGLDFTLK